MPEIISRKEALALGLKRYFTGQTCGRGHLVERLASEGDCVECERLQRVRRRSRLLGLSEERGIPGRPPVIGVRDVALAQGRSRYFTGLPCKFGHVAERLVVNRHCIECQRRRQRAAPRRGDPILTRVRLAEWKTLNPERAKAAALKWRNANRQKEREIARRWKQNNPEKVREIKRRWLRKNPHKQKEYTAKYGPQNKKRNAERQQKMRAALRILESLGIQIQI